MRRLPFVMVVLAAIAVVTTPSGLGAQDDAGTVASRGGAPPPVAGAPALVPVDGDRSGTGLVLVDAEGRVAALAGALDHGDLSDVRLNAPVVGLAATASGAGYWLVAADGGVFAHGDAPFLGSLGSTILNQPVVGIAPTPTGQGYWLVAADGGVFAYGDAPFLGSLGSTILNQPVVGIAATPTGQGYWLVAADGGVFAYGDAPFLGADITGDVPVVDLAPAPGGYWVALADGTVRSAGGAPAPDGPLPAGRTTAVVAAEAGYWLIGTGQLLPGGTTTVFSDRMLVAHYGTPLTPLMGVLGETGPEEAADRIEARADEWRALGRRVLPTMEIIASIATSFPGADADYSSPTDPAVLRPWIDVARDRGQYVLLDLQPGRTDFLTQARRYEELLLEPHVGLALDPEWRMGPTEVPGRVIGSVDAAEVNAVSAWLDELVAANGLPEKLFVVHQFTEAMVRDRGAVVDRPHLATTFHIDGFGTQAQKLAKYRQLRPTEPYDIGFKLFIDEDTRMFTPTEVLAFDVVPDLVTYQ